MLFLQCYVVFRYNGFLDHYIRWKTRRPPPLLPPGVNFINMFTYSFCASRSQKRKKLLDLAVFFSLLGSASVKAAHIIMVKLTPLLSTFYLFSYFIDFFCFKSVSLELPANMFRLKK